MGNFLLQRGLLLYILAPESCDSYMIFYNNYELCLFVFICLFLSEWGVSIIGVIRKRDLLWSEAMIDGRC